MKTNKNATRDYERPGQMMYRISGYRFSDWSERDPQKKLHFNDQVRLRAGRCIIKYFRSLYKMTEKDLRKERDEIIFLGVIRVVQ